MRSRANSKVSHVDDIKSHVTRATNKTKGTEYPPLPMSVQGETNIWSPTSQTSKLPKTHSRAPSVSPSDSASHVHIKKALKSPKLKSIPSVPPDSPKRGNGGKHRLLRYAGHYSLMLSHQPRHIKADRSHLIDMLPLRMICLQ